MTKKPVSYVDHAEVIIPRGVRCTVLADEDPPIGTLIFETADGDVIIAVNQQVSAILKQALGLIDEAIGKQQ